MEEGRQLKYQRAMELIEQGHKILKELDETIPQEPKKSKPKKITGCIDEFRGTQASHWLSSVTHDLQSAWLSTYPSADWIKTELLKANTWICANPARAPKNFGRFMTTWLMRGFESYRKNIPARGVNQDGFYMTQAMKVSHNNQLMLGKVRETMNAPEERDVGAPSPNGRVP